MGSNSFLSTNCHAQLALRPPQRHHPWQNGASLRHQLWIDLEWTSLLGHQYLGRNNAWTACCWLPLLHSCRAGHHSQCPHFLLNLRAVDRHTFVIESLSLFKNRLQVSNVMKKNKNEIHLQQCSIWKSKMNLKKKSWVTELIKHQRGTHIFQKSIISEVTERYPFAGSKAFTLSSL